MNIINTEEVIVSLQKVYEALNLIHVSGESDIGNLYGSISEIKRVVLALRQQQTQTEAQK